MRHEQPDETTPLGQLLAELKALRKGNGLTRVKVARATTLCGLPVVSAEALRLGLRPEQAAYHLLIATVHGLKDAQSRGLLINALALDNTPPGKGTGDRRRRYLATMNESNVLALEDEALYEVALWLSEMTHPEALFGNYASPEVIFPPVEWKVGSLVEPVGVDEVHPREEVVWDFLEKAVCLNEKGFIASIETRGIIRAVVDGVTGYTIHHTANTGSIAKGIHLIEGGKPGRKHALGALGTTRINIDFAEPLARNRTLRLHWVMNLELGQDVRQSHGLAQAPEVPTRDLTLKAYFDDRKLPVSPCHFIGEPDRLPEPYGPKRPLRLQPGNCIAHSWSRPDRQKVYAIAWQWSDEFTKRSP